MTEHTTQDVFNRMIESESPLAGCLGLRLESVGAGTARVRVTLRKELMRPGGVVNGPVIMAVADFAMYAAIRGLDRRGHNR